MNLLPIAETLAEPSPPHPGTVLRDRVLPGLGLSVSRAARELGICRQTLHHILAGTAIITPNMAARLAKLSGLPGSFWLTLQYRHDLARAEIELIGALAAIPAHALSDALQTELIGHVHIR